MTHRWSVSIMAEGDRIIELDEVVELADAGATAGGIASGMGTASYGAQIIVEGADAEEAAQRAVEIFNHAVHTAGLPVWPITQIETIREDEEIDYEWEPM